MNLSLASSVLFLREARRFVTLGREDKHDPVGIVLEKFFLSTPDFGKSVVNKEKRKNGWTLTGSWPSSGKQIFDWEMEVWGERGGDVVVKMNMWSGDGKYNDGIVYRVTLGNVDKSLERWLRKFYYPAKSEMKARAA